MAFIKKNTPTVIGNDERGLVRDYVGLINQLTDADPAARRWAARDLLLYPQATAALVARLQVETDISVREIILTSLTRLGGEIAVTGLVDCLRSEDAQMRNEAIEAMKALPDEVAPIMGGLLIDADPDVRIMAVNILESLRHPKVEEWLIDVIDHDPIVNVCGTAVDLLGEVGSVAAHDALQRLKQRFAAEPYIQFATDLALKRIVKA
ncbi:MAG: HEAT repeat domain-containing protein [Undibacterium sp.]|uniref:HEAT repeat domain-containing protein n=1 Tax=Undibacterium sp. TaxID=1914977 RepID=UPI00271D4AE7|nr:HEAT repeat domain-containing protein [Undibacterium sp.]MDO8652208.1 HEAT repeat domain-containing protein [Undibacterium sp.]